MLPAGTTSERSSTAAAPVAFAPGYLFVTWSNSTLAAPRPPPVVMLLVAPSAAASPGPNDSGCAAGARTRSFDQGRPASLAPGRIRRTACRGMSPPV